MVFGTCKSCKEQKNLTKHSKIGDHKPPYVMLCRECHDKQHGIKMVRFKRTQRGNSKNAKGTSRRKNR